MFLTGLLLLLATSAYGRTPKIIGGEEAEIKDFPYQVSVQLYGIHFCGGSIISPNFIITAAHCVAPLNNDPKYIGIRAGSKYLREGGQTIDVKTLITHPQYNTRNSDFDVALLELVTPLSFNGDVQPIKLTLTEIESSKIVKVSGWGLTAENGNSSSNVLLAASVPTVSRDLCESFYPKKITGNMFCAGFVGGQVDACQGDSGGPLVYHDELVGIVSWGVGCGRPNKPGVYSNVPNFLDFVNKHVY